MEEQLATTDKVKKSLSYVTAIGVLLLILGIVALYYPEGIGEVTVTIIGVFLIIGGMLRLMFSFLSFSMGSLFMKVIYSLIMIFAGGWVIMNPDMGLKGLTMVFAVYFLVDGLTTLVYSFNLMPIGGGMYMLLDAIVSLVIGGFILYNWPETGQYALGTYLGIKLILDGLMLTLTGQAVKKFISN